MYRVLIADDEYWVGRWLADVLAKSPYDIKMCIRDSSTALSDERSEEFQAVGP